ncbi:MAG: UvrD-helicase domain-containing protein, partial [Deltaproteobacteria bacterium]|nr:UvrD-helicase domain-containing protein [Deltaproteobacteria bacterium]
MDALVTGLNDEQRRAVDTLDGPLLILAGAGSGKTRVLTRRIARLLERGTVGDDPYGPSLRPWNILAVTFTNKAAGEMKHRVEQLVGEAARNVWISTFHSTCVRILRQDIEPLGYTRDFVIYDDDDQLRVVKLVLQELKINPKDLAPAAVRSRIDKHKNGIGAGGFIPRSDPFPKILELYNTRLKLANALDFNDLLNKVVDLFSAHEAVRRRWQERWRYVLVDEYQDTNPAQYSFLRLLCEGEAPNLAVVGDDDQSIYRFRGADIQNILGFEKDFPSCAVIRLEENYRSKGHILRAASGVVKNNKLRKAKTLWTRADLGEQVHFSTPDDDQAEAEGVVRWMERLGRPWGDYAVIYRTNAASRPVEQALSRARIPFVLVGGKKFYERLEVKDLVAYLRLVLNPDDDLAFARIVNVPARGFGEKAMEGLRQEAARRGVPLRAAAREMGKQGGRVGNTLAAFTLLLDRFEGAARQMAVGDLVMYVATESGYLAALEQEDSEEARGRVENIRELARAAAAAAEEDDGEGEAPVGGEATGIAALRLFLDRATLSAQADDLPDEGTRVATLLTAHLAKGLEFPVVFVVGMCEKSFPHARSETEDDLEEERRLAYVAFTRARERLFLSAPLRRRAPEGWWDDAIPSRFVTEIPPEALTEPPRGGFRRPAPGSLGLGRPAAPPAGF